MQMRRPPPWAALGADAPARPENRLASKGRDGAGSRQLGAAHA